MEQIPPPLEELFKKVATIASLKKPNFQKPEDKVPPWTYDQKHFQLDGSMELGISFKERVTHTSLCVKMVDHDQLLLSEGIFRQVGIDLYHDKFEHWRSGKKKSGIQ